MPDHTPKFDPIPRLQQIAATIEESGGRVFDCPHTAVHYINCAINEIERLRKERDAARQDLCYIEAADSSTGDQQQEAAMSDDPASKDAFQWEVASLMFDCMRDDIKRLTHERNEARQRTNSILTEIDCRIEHGAESNGHLEVLRDMFKENTND